MKQNRLDSIVNTENVEKNYKSLTLSFTVHDGTHTHCTDGQKSTDSITNHFCL